MNATKKSSKKKSVASLLSELQLPYSHGLLYRAGLIPADANAVTVMRVMLRLIRVPAIAKGRQAGLMVEDILQNLSARTMQRIRKRVRVKR
jgi:hypothetical protein